MAYWSGIFWKRWCRVAALISMTRMGESVRTRGGASHRFDDAHFAEEIALLDRGEDDGVRSVGAFDDFDLALRRG